MSRGLEYMSGEDNIKITAERKTKAEQRKVSDSFANIQTFCMSAKSLQNKKKKLCVCKVLSGKMVSTHTYTHTHTTLVLLYL